MGSIRHPKLFDAATVEAIRSAYYDVWAQVEADQLPRRERGRRLQGRDHPAAY